MTFISMVVDSADMATLAGIRVLVVEDDPDTRDVVAVMLERAGAEVLHAASSAAGILVVEQARPDAIVADIEMPGEDGYAFVSKLRALPAARGGATPAVALTAYASLTDRLVALRSGFQVYVPKPVAPADLVTIVARLVGKV